MSLDATYTSTTTAFGLTATPASGTALPATDPSQYGNRPLAAFLQATVANIRFTTDGSTPTASHGSVLTVGNDPFLYAGTLVDLQFIRESAGAILNVVYGAVTDTVGPQGPPGTTGQTGPTGATGAAGADGVVQSVVAGTNITVDNTDPANPVVSAGGGGGGMLSVDFNLTDAQIKNLRAVDYELVDAPGAGFAIYVEKLAIMWDCRNGAYNFGDNSPDYAELSFGFADYWQTLSSIMTGAGPGTPTDTILYPMFVNNSSSDSVMNQFTYVLASANALDLTVIDNVPICFGNIGTEEIIGGGAGNSLSGRLWYTIVPVVPL